MVAHCQSSPPGSGDGASPPPSASEGAGQSFQLSFWAGRSSSGLVGRRRRSPPSAEDSRQRRSAVRAAARGAERGSACPHPAVARAARALGARAVRGLSAPPRSSRRDGRTLEGALAGQVVEGEPARQHRQPQRHQPEQQHRRARRPPWAGPTAIRPTVSVASTAPTPPGVGAADPSALPARKTTATLAIAERASLVAEGADRRVQAHHEAGRSAAACRRCR